MTIYKTDPALNSERKDLIDDTVDVEVQCVEKKSLTKDEDELDYCVYNDPVVPIRRQPRPAQRRTCLQICLCLAMLTGLTVSVMASLYLYHTMSTVRYRGRCGVGIVDMARWNMTGGLPSSAVQKPSALRQPKGESLVYEDVEIDDQVETILTPSLPGLSNGIVKHDFNKVQPCVPKGYRGSRNKFVVSIHVNPRNVTAIQDDDLDLCYLLPLLSKEFVSGPRDFYNKLQQYEHDGVYPQLPVSLRHYMVDDGVIDDLVDDLTDLCDQHKPLRASPSPDTHATLPPTTTQAVTSNNKRYLMYAGGDYIVDYELSIGIYYS